MVIMKPFFPYYIFEDTCDESRHLIVADTEEEAWRKMAEHDGESVKTTKINHYIVKTGTINEDTVMQIR